MTDFQHDVIEASQDQPVLVDLYATWCGPCQMLAPVLENAVRESSTPILLVKIDTDQQPAIAARLGVSSIPDVRLYHLGEEVGAFVGFRPLPQVQRWIRDRLLMAQHG